MKTVFISFLGCLSLVNCSCSTIKLHPEYKGVDPKVQELVNEYKDLAKIQGITFKNEVTVGFKNIDDGNAVGVTTYGWGWREIALDKDFWSNSNSLKRTALLFHELTHAYCGRPHDYGKDKYYPDPEVLRDPNYKKPTEGYFPDECPVSLMVPILPEDDCLMIHLGDYEKEMLERCSPY